MWFCGCFEIFSRFINFREKVRAYIEYFLLSGVSVWRRELGVFLFKNLERKERFWGLGKEIVYKVRLGVYGDIYGFILYGLVIILVM